MVLQLNKSTICIGLNVLNYLKMTKETVKVKNFMVQCNVAHAFAKTAEFRERKPMFV